jgi:hypothetical protein
VVKMVDLTADGDSGAEKEGESLQSCDIFVFTLVSLWKDKGVSVLFHS